MPIEGIVIQEFNFEMYKVGVIEPGYAAVMPVMRDDEPELLAIHCFNNDEGGALYAFSDFDPEWQYKGVPPWELKEENIVGCVWPDEMYRRRVVGRLGTSGLLILRYIRTSSESG